MRGTLRLALLAGSLLAARCALQAQYWGSAGFPNWGGPADPEVWLHPDFFYVDGVEDALYASGIGFGAYPLMRFRENTWDTVAVFGNQVHSVVRYNDTLLVAGGFNWVNDTTVLGRIGYMVNATWHPYGNFQGLVSRLRIINGELYAVGTFQDVDGIFCNGIAKRVGGTWQPVGDLPSIPFTSPPWIHDVVEFEGNLVVTGNFTSVDQTINDIMEFDGTAWSPLGAGILGGVSSGGSLAVYQNQLYVGGSISQSGGNAGKGIMRWDGTAWAALPGDGLQIYNNSDQYPPVVQAMEVHDDLLFVVGGFYFANHIPANQVATWDGSNWCSVGGAPDDPVAALGFYHDTLYIGSGSFADGVQVNGIAKFIGATYQLACSSMGIGEAAPEAGEIQVLSPSPGSIAISGLADGPHTLRVYDPQGRLLLAKTVKSAAGRTSGIELGERTNALYILQVDGVQTAKYIPAP